MSDLVLDIDGKKTYVGIEDLKGFVSEIIEILNEIA